MDLFGKILNAIFSISVMALGLGLLVFAVPLWIINGDFHVCPLEIDGFRFIGLALVLLGILATTGFVWGWIASGTGSPLPFDVPKELIVRGSYRFVRNPMYVGYLLVVFGEFLFFKSSALLLYLLTLFLFLHAFVVFVEEPMLKRQFGESYEEYCKSVPRWIPRLKPFRGDIAKSS